MYYMYMKLFEVDHFFRFNDERVLCTIEFN